LWFRVERTLSIHSIDRPRRELFYWAAVVATFGLGAAASDLTAMTLNLGYFWSIVLFAVVIAVPAAGYRWWRWNPIFCFWFAYVVTLPLGASVADWMGKPSDVGGFGLRTGEAGAGAAHHWCRRLPGHHADRRRGRIRGVAGDIRGGRGGTSLIVPVT
jgi:uncharacterized membrane-anchored protein